MYDILVERLRSYSENFVAYKLDANFASAVQEAADAIEELSAYVQMLEELRKDGWYLQKTKMMTYGQATITRPIPEPPKEG